MKTFLDWSAYQDAGMGDAYADIPKSGGDFAKAVAVCINSRQCETTGKGVMCPSYRVGENPALSTGARVRLLKAALNGELGASPFTHPELAEAMELCVSCKGCKRECENNVDMAQLKIEYLAQANAQIGLSLRGLLFARLPHWLNDTTWFSGLITLRNRHAWLAYLGEHLLGISARRQLPEPAATPFKDPASAETTGQPVILFVDTFTHHFEPRIAEAAVAVLSAAGYAVSIARSKEEDEALARPLCCGRSYLSQGMVAEARREAWRVVTALLPHARAGVPIIGLEPSCLLTLRDEYKALGLGEEVEILAQQAVLFEEFLAREHTARRLNLPLRALDPQAAPALIHGHCHQKAVGAMKAMRKVLKLIPDFQFEMVDAACCGMAGSFGLEAEHAEMSLAMAEQDLLPALRAKPEAAIVANGFSCRQQISDGIQRQPQHLALLLEAALDVSSDISG